MLEKGQGRGKEESRIALKDPRESKLSLIINDGFRPAPTTAI